MPTIGVLDKDEAPQTINTIPDPGRGAAAASRSTAMCTEDKAVLDALAADADTIAGAISGGKMATKEADGDNATVGAKADAAAAADDSTASLMSFFKRLVAKIKSAGQGTMANSHPVAIASDQSALPVKTAGTTIRAEFTRPSDTTAYAANDVVGYTGSADTTLIAAIFSENGGTGYVVKAELWTDQAANVSPFRMYLFNVEPTPIADNSAFTLLYADISKCIGYIDFSNVSQEGSGSTGALGLWTGQLFAKADASADDIYCVLVTKAAFTPASAQKFTICLSMDRN